MSDINRFVNMVRVVEKLPVDMSEYEPGDMVMGDCGAILVKVCHEHKFELYDGALSFYLHGTTFSMSGAYWGVQLFANELGWNDVYDILRGLAAWDRAVQHEAPTRVT